MEKYPLIRTIYLYLFTIIGLILLTIGGVRFLDMGLKAFVFTKADEEQRILYWQPSYAPIAAPQLEKIAETGETGISLTEAEKASIKQWLVDYNYWKENMQKVDPVTARRQRDASLNLAMILIGLPLYLYHWRIIKKETKNN